MTGAAQAALVRAALFFLVVSLAQRVLGLLANYCGMRVGWAASNALRIDLVAHTIQLDLSFHKAHPPGALIERLDGDVEVLADFFSSFAVDLVGNALLIAGILVVVTLESVELGVMLLFYCIVALAVLVRAQRLAPPHWRASRQCETEFYGYVGEMLTATEDIRSCGAAGHAVRRFLRYLRAWWPVELRGHLWGSIWLATAVVSVIGGALARALAGPMALRGTMTLGTLYAIAHYMEMVTWGPIQGIQWRLQGLQHAQVSIGRVRELLSTQPAVAEGHFVLPPGSVSIAFRDVGFAYPDALAPAGDTDKDRSQAFDERSLRRGVRESALQGLSFTLDAGQVLGLLGRTGSGKTTVARLLYRFYDPQEGRVEVNGVDLRQAETASLRARIGMVTQDVQLFRASLRDNLTFFDPNVPDQTLLDTLEALGLSPWLERLPQGLDTPIAGGTLSAGEAQIVALARVFLQDPDLVILDEAASRLDPATEDGMQLNPAC